ncbi:MAG: hypothetical protein WED07_13545 [Candidatus Freyarchaeum deiterrae]
MRKVDWVKNAGFTASVAGGISTFALVVHYYLLFTNGADYLSNFLFLVYSGFRGVDLIIFLSNVGFGILQTISFAFCYLSLISGIAIVFVGALLLAKKGPIRILGWLLPILLIPEMLGFALNPGPAYSSTPMEIVVLGFTSFSVIYAALMLWPAFSKKLEGASDWFPY